MPILKNVVMDIKLNQPLNINNLMSVFRVQNTNLKLDSFQVGATHQFTILTAENLLQLFS